MDISRLHNEFKTEQQCIDHLAAVRWKGRPRCTYCLSERVYKRNGSKRLKCRDCNKSFSVTVGTIFHSTKLPLSKWYLAISVVLSAKKGISSRQLARTIDVTSDTAWYMQYRLRLAMNEDNSLYGLVEVDETYVGGNTGNMSKRKKNQRNPHSGGMVHKKAVLGMLDRGNGRVRLVVLEHANGITIKPIMKRCISKRSKIVTDGFGGYYGLGNHFEKHIKINSEKRQKAWGRYNLSSIEGFFSMIKRAVMGQYHHLSYEHLQSYMNEIAFKKNHGAERAFTLLLNRACAFC